MNSIITKHELWNLPNKQISEMMKGRLLLLLFITLMCVQNSSWAQTKVLIDDLYYNLSGSYASVAPNTQTDYPFHSTYTSDIYIIPSTVFYKNIEYTVNCVGLCAFCSQYSFGEGYGSIASTIILPNTIISVETNAFSGCKNLSHVNLANIQEIGSHAFYQCTSLSHIIIPKQVIAFGIKNPFEGCNLLREIIYLPSTAPSNWVATSKTYVPDKQSYSLPKYSINNAQVIEMITFDKTEFDYTGQAPSTTWTNNVDGYTASLSLSALSGEVGTHEEWIPVTFTKGDEMFTANVVYRYAVKPTKLTAKVNNVSREYGDDNPQFNISYSGFVNGENESVFMTQPTVSTTATKSSNVGEYPITISGGSAANYELVYEPGLLTVTKAPLSAKVNDATKVYGAQNPAFTIDYYGLKNNESTPAWTTSPSFQTDATQASGVGAYTVNAIYGVPVNYDLGVITAGTLNITPAPLTIKANDAVRQYYSDDPIFSYTCNGFVNGDNKSVLVTTPRLSTTATRSSNVGTYEIRVGETSSPNYSISFVNATLTITPRTLIASVDNYERSYNEENPVFEVKYNGFVGDDDEKVLISKPEAKTTATKTTDVGTYPINVTGGSADNYTFSYTSGILTINKAEQTISWGQNLSALSVDDQVELKAEASSGLPITYTMDQTNIAEIYSTGKKYYLDCKGEGTFQIVAVQNGDNNYYSSTKVRKTVTIGNGSGIDETVQKYKLTYKVNGTEYLTIEVEQGNAITPEAVPSKEGYTFSGWSEIPATMPANDVTVTGTFTINKYKLTYKVDGKEYKAVEVEYGKTITPETEPTKDGYTFSGWVGLPNTMPAKDVTVAGTFSKEEFNLIYLVDGDVYKTMAYSLGDAITPEAAPKKEGYTFSGWSEIPATMPAEEVTVTGTFTINKYKLTYNVDGEEFKTVEVEYGKAITPETEPTKDGYVFSGWVGLPATMPAKDVTVAGTFSKGAFKLVYLVDGEVYKTMAYSLDDAITPEAEPTKDGYTFSGWSSIPETMPANDVKVTGTFTKNAPMTYMLTYKVDGQVYKTFSYQYGESITPEPEPTKDGYTFSGWSWIPKKMPDEDVTITGTFTPSTGVETAVGSGRPFDVYTVTGRKVRSQVTSLKGLKKGVYIVEGKKVVVK